MAGYTNTARGVAIDAIKAAAATISAHTADPGTTGTSEVTGGGYARQATTWGSTSAGSTTGSQISASIPAGTTITHWGLWTSGGTFYGGFALTSPEVFGSAGTWQHTPTINAT